MRVAFLFPIRMPAPPAVAAALSAFSLKTFSKAINIVIFIPLVFKLCVIFLLKNYHLVDLQPIERVVAQPGSAHVWGAWGRKFESCLPDKKVIKQNLKLVNVSVYKLF